MKTLIIIFDSQMGWLGKFGTLYIDIENPTLCRNCDSKI
jgi:hypothetical protein